MSAQNYCMVNEDTNVCENVVLWDGNPDSWTPPTGYLMLPQAITPAKNWVWIADAWVLEVNGEGQIGYTWDGTYLITNEPQPTAPGTVEGAQTL